MRGTRRAASVSVLSLMIAVLGLALPSPARAACEVPLPGDTGGEEATCGPLDQNPPPVDPPARPPKLILWTSGYDLNPFNSPKLGIWISRLDGTQRRRLTNFASSLDRDFAPHGLNLPDDHPSFSPDNRKIVFTSNRAQVNNWEIYVMNVNGTGVQRLTNTPGLDTEPVFSPDGKKIAFATQRFGQLDIAVMDSNGANVRRLTTSTFEDIEPAWRPDGQEIAFSRQFSDNEKEIFVIKPDGSGQRQITFVPGEDHDPTYSPNGQQLVITSERAFSPPYGNVHKIQVSDGVELGNLTGDLEFGAGDPFWSRDGTQIAFFHAATPLLRGPQLLYVMRSDGVGKFRIPGEALANIHPAIGVGVDDDRDGTPNYLESGSVGKTGISPRRIRAGRTTLVRFWWKHPQRWKRLDSFSLRLSQVRWLRGTVGYSVAQRAFSLFDGTTNTYSPTRRRGRGRLRARLLTLDLRRTRIVNVDRKKLELVLALRFPRSLAGRRLRLRAQANDNRGRHQEDELGTLRIGR